VDKANYTIEQYATNSSLIDIQLESVKIQKSKSNKSVVKAGLNLQVTVSFELQEISNKEHLLFSLTVKILGNGENGKGEKVSLFSAEVISKSIFLLDFDYNQKQLLKDCESNKKVQKVFINQIYPIIIDHAKDTLNKMGFIGLAIPLYIPDPA